MNLARMNGSRAPNNGSEARPRSNCSIQLTVAKRSRKFCCKRILEMSGRVTAERATIASNPEIFNRVDN